MVNSDLCESNDFKFAPDFSCQTRLCFKIVKQFMRPGNMKTTLTSRLSGH